MGSSCSNSADDVVKKTNTRDNRPNNNNNNHSGVGKKNNYSDTNKNIGGYVDYLFTFKVNDSENNSSKFDDLPTYGIVLIIK